MYDYLKYIYYFSTLQYIYTTYTTHPDCPFKYIAQLSFWICIGWAYYFTTNTSKNIDTNTNINNLLFTLKIYEILFLIKKNNIHINLSKINLSKIKFSKIYLHIYSFIVHFVGLFVAIYFMKHKLKKVNLKNVTYTCTVSILYFILFVIYQKTNKTCYPESAFHLNNPIHIIILLIFTILVGSYIYITYK